MSERRDQLPEYDRTHGHAREGTSVKGVLVTVGVIIALLILSHIVVTILAIWYLEAWEPLSAPFGPSGDVVPADPAPSVLGELRTLRLATEAQSLANLQVQEVTDPQSGYGRIPIERATQILAERGLPDFSNEAALPQEAPVDGGQAP